MAVKPIPQDKHTVTPQITVSNANKAIDFYKKALGAQEINRHLTPDGRVMHADIRIGDSSIFVTDAFPEMGGCHAPSASDNPPYVLTLYVENADAIFNRAVEAGAKVTMPIADMFWGDRYGQFADPFGCRWAVATHIEDVSPQELGRRAEAMFAQPAHK